MEDGYYWYIPDDDEELPELREPQPIKVENGSMYICGSTEAYPVEEHIDGFAYGLVPVKFYGTVQ